MKHLFCSLILLLIIILPVSATSGDGVLRKVTLLAGGVSDGDVIRLGQIAQIDPPTAELADHVVAWAPPAGNSRRITKRTVVDSLRDCFDFPVSLSGVSGCLVHGNKESQPVLPLDEILAMALDELSAQRPDLTAFRDNIELIIQPSRIPRGRAEKCDLQLSGSSGRGVGGTLTVRWAERFVRRIPFTLNGRVSLKVWKVNRDIDRTEVLSRDDVTEEWMETGLSRRDDLITELSIPREAKNAIRQGTILRDSMLAPWFAVKRGKKIRLRADKGSISLEMPGEAMESGNVGDKIRVRNSQSGRTIQARIADSDGLCIMTEGI